MLGAMLKVSLILSCCLVAAGCSNTAAATSQSPVIQETATRSLQTHSPASHTTTPPEAPAAFSPEPSPSATATPTPTETDATDYILERIASLGIDGFDNLTISALEVFEGELYAGTRNYETGGEVWKLTGNRWTRVVDLGFCTGCESSPNPIITDFEVFNGQLYAGTFDFGLGGLFRSEDADRWEHARPRSLEFHGPEKYQEATSLFVINGWLYAVFAENISLGKDGFQILRTTTGYPLDWEVVVRDGFGDPENAAILTHEWFGDRLFVGTYNLSGRARIYTTRNGLEWKMLSDFEQDGISNRRVTALDAFDGWLYAAVVERGEWDEIADRVYRCRDCDGEDWEMVFDGPYRFPGTYYKPGLEPYDGYLYLVVGNVRPLGGTRSSYGLEIWRTPDGLSWEKIGDGGLGNPKNDFTYFDAAMIVFEGSLYIGYDNDNSGGGIWKITHLGQ